MTLILSILWTFWIVKVQKKVFGQSGMYPDLSYSFICWVESVGKTVKLGMGWIKLHCRRALDTPDIQAKSTDRDNVTANQRFRRSDFVT